MKKRSLFIVFGILLVGLIACKKEGVEFESSTSDLVFNALAQTWDEAIPLGNGMIGNLVWQKEGKLRFSLDRVDLWDLRPMENIDFDTWKFNDVYEHWKADTYDEVQKAFDAPYDKLPAPSKIPAGALEFDVASLGKVETVRLNIKSATCIVKWDSGAKLTAFIHAEKPVGWYMFENLTCPIKVAMIPPAYNRKNKEGHTSQSRNDLNQLGYEQGEVIENDNSITYNQKGWDTFKYQIATQWERSKKSLTGSWSVSSANNGWPKTATAKEVVSKAMVSGMETALTAHLDWWGNYWSKSSIAIPDTLLQKQYELEMYKFGAVARSNAPPIALQAVWTADHGKLPPWKGDFHHDLNTQLSYWPSYAGNHIELEEGFLNWLWKYRPAFKKYTEDYFEAKGMNVPGVTTLEGEPMGGWIQYSFGQTVGAWLSHHFYLHWQFTQDEDFLKEKAYPWLKDVSIFIDDISIVENGKRGLKISSSPEIFNNSRKAWFAGTTNFDLALIRWNLEKTAELARKLQLDEEAAKWTKQLSEWPELAVDKETGFMFAPSFPYNESHRHFSHLMGYHPLGLVDFSYGDADKDIIRNTLKNLEKQGPDYWTGYSYSWQGNLYARAFEGDKAARVLTTFAQCFCLKNSFHANGDQCKAGHSTMTYRPFTLEGNFAFASAIQEMLLQSHTGIIRLFPAIPATWKDVSFKKLRTVGAFLVSAEMKSGKVQKIEIESVADGVCSLANPFLDFRFDFYGTGELKESGENIEINMAKGQKVVLSAVGE
ncbi:MAG: glycoside hydrolase N-terminal domain-containing protein [Maribacter sp.]|nr:glycoside hydrolase N-terminal domain-containing protein [Maribacter sp.]